MTSSMRLRTKMALWYTGFTFAAIVAFCISLYGIVSYALQQSLENEASLAMDQIIAQLENEDGIITFENEVPVSNNIMFYVTESNGSEVAAYGSDITVFDQIPVQENTFTTAPGGGTEWLLLDSSPIYVDHFVLRVRVAASYARNLQLLSLLRLLFYTGVPLMALLSLLGGFGIAKRSLRPIQKIITSAGIISKGALGERIPTAPAKDELGELTDALNEMLSHVEAAFEREKQFSSDASHELRTPVSVIRAYTETLLADELLTSDQRTSLETVLTECLRMQKMIHQLLTITKGHGKQYTLLIETINLYDVIDSVSETMQEQLACKHIALNVKVPKSLELPADQSLLTQMLLNLVENAVKYGKDYGSIVLNAKQQNTETVITVEDDGIGIAKEALPHIFDRFFRADASRDRSGTGLGLSIVQQIVAAHHGTIAVTSQPGKGTCFTITLPFLTQ